MRPSRFACLLLSLALSACSAVQPVATPTGPAIDIQVFAYSQATQKARPLRTQDSLFDSDYVTLRLQLQSSHKPTYVYVVQLRSAEVATQLFPRRGHALLSPGQILTAPDVVNPEDGIAVADAAELRFYVVTSPEPLSRSVCSLLRLRCPRSSGPDNGPERGEDDEEEPPRQAERSAKRETRPDDERRGDERLVTLPRAVARGIYIIPYILRLVPKGPAQTP